MRMNWRSVAVHAVAVVAVAASTIGGVVAASTDAHSVTPGNRADQPTEHVACPSLWMNDHTAADEDRCRARGWVVRPAYILSASGDKMWTGVGPCSTEDGRGCYWNARLQGNECGFGFVQLRRLGTFTHLVKINGRWASRPCPRCGPQR